MEFKTYTPTPPFTTGYTDTNGHFHESLEKAEKANKRILFDHNTYQLADYYTKYVDAYMTIFQVQELIKQILKDPQPFIELHKIESKI